MYAGSNILQSLIFAFHVYLPAYTITFNGTSNTSDFGCAVSYSPSGTQLAIGAQGVHTNTGMCTYGRADACKW